jgi:hypothetical protein
MSMKKQDNRGFLQVSGVEVQSLKRKRRRRLM